jgi:2-keto-4-pentenoate hydratase
VGPEETVAAPDVHTAAAELHDARLTGRPIPTLSSRWPGMTVADAYAVQAAGLALRKVDGEHVTGGKLGFTSAAMRTAMGVANPNYGWLTDAMSLHDGTVTADRFIHPKVEPEIAFLLGSDLSGPVTTADVLTATESVAACLEVVDSRYQGFRFTALDNIADNSSAGGVVLGEPCSPDGIDLRLVGVVLEGDGAVVSTAAGAAAHDHPAAAVAWMVAHCETVLPAGSWIISGGLTAPVDLPIGRPTGARTVTATFDRLGPVTLTVA